MLYNCYINSDPQEKTVKKNHPHIIVIVSGPSAVLNTPNNKKKNTSETSTLIIIVRGLSLVLNKGVTRLGRPDSIHTSCRSESSNY